jgi:small nuclear ribonucleoprotein (snRNP)-like protein
LIGATGNSDRLFVHLCRRVKCMAASLAFKTSFVKSIIIKFQNNSKYEGVLIRP